MTSRSLVAVLAPTATSHANTNPNEKRTTKDRKPWGLRHCNHSHADTAVDCWVCRLVISADRKNQTVTSNGLPAAIA